MKIFAAIAIMALSSVLVSAQSSPATYVYVSNAEDDDIGMYTLESDGSLQPAPRYKAGKVVMPMTVSADTEKQPRGFRIDLTGRFLIAAGEMSDTFSTYSIDAASGALKPIGKYPTGKGSNWVEILSFD